MLKNEPFCVTNRLKALAKTSSGFIGKFNMKKSSSI